MWPLLHLFIYAEIFDCMSCSSEIGKLKWFIDKVELLDNTDNEFILSNIVVDVEFKLSISNSRVLDNEFKLLFIVADVEFKWRNLHHDAVCCHTTPWEPGWCMMQQA